jgi:hypothetical protein
MILGEGLLSLVYFLWYKKCFGRRYQIMKEFLKGAAIVVVVCIVLWAINMIFHMNGYELDMVPLSAIASVSSMLIYRRWSKKEKDKE